MLIAAAILAAMPLQIEIDGADCLIEDRVAQIEARIEPVAQVARARLYFHSALESQAYFVEMALSANRFVAEIPGARGKSGSVTMHVEALALDGTNVITAPRLADVVSSAGQCGTPRRIATVVEDREVTIFTTGTSLERPKGYAGVKDVRVAPTAGQERKDRRDGDVSVPGAELSAVAPPGSVQEEYKIGVDDVLKVIVYGHDDLAQTVVVQADGSFMFPLIGRVVALDLSEEALGRRIAEMLAAGFVRNPQVTVVVTENHSKAVFVLGEVSRPGNYPIHGRSTLVEVLVKAAPTANAGTEVLVVRPLVRTEGPILPDDIAGGMAPAVTRASSTEAEVMRVNMRDIQMGSFDKNIVLKPNDTVFVTQASKVYILGEVRNPGAFTFTPTLTVRQAISMAGGFTPDASTGKVRIIRDTRRKPKDSIKADLDAALQPNDTVLVKAKLF